MHEFKEGQILRQWNVTGGKGPSACWLRLPGQALKPGFHYTVNAMTTTQKQSDCKVEQSSFTLIALFWLEISRCRGSLPWS